MPVVISKINNSGNQHWEGLIFISFEYGQEVVILEEAHRPICHLQMSAADTSNDSSEESWD
jgi:hypothetical protein